MAFLKSHLVSVAKNSDKVHLVTDGKIWAREIDLTIGQKLNSSPDHHGSFFYAVKDIAKSGVLVEYETQFDHRSFGKDLITIDKGEFEIGYGAIH